MKVPISINESVSVLDGGDLVDKAYAGMLALMGMVEPSFKNHIAVHRYGGDRLCRRNGKSSKILPSESDWIAGLQLGVYMPGVKRDYWLGNFDIGVDPLPANGCVYCSADTDDGETFAYVHVRSLGGFGSDIISGCQNPVARYRVSHVAYMENGSPFPHEWPAKIRTHTAYLAIDGAGSVWACHERKKLRELPTSWAAESDRYLAYHCGAGALSLLADRRFLWLVETEESLKDLPAAARMQFGIDPEMAKSLFYSRTIPVTATGRLKPILHWVQAHKRRIEKGIEIDVSKYLRGVESFEMGGLKFRITSPVKLVKPQPALKTLKAA